MKLNISLKNFLSLEEMLKLRPTSLSQNVKNKEQTSPTQLNSGILSYKLYITCSVAGKAKQSGNMY
jgi:hypothetical protein